MTELKRDDRRYIAELLTWEAARRPVEWVLANIALMVGCVLIGAAVTTMAARPVETVVFCVIIPAFVLGMGLVGLCLFAHARIRERERFAQILRHLGCG